MMIKPLHIGNTVFPVNLIQGPLAGVSCAPFRYLTTRYGQVAYAYTEMISCKTLLTGSIALQRRYIEKSPHEGPVCFQLSGNDPRELAHAVQRVTDYGADLIDLNCGCPVKKIRKKGSGSKLLTEPVKLYELIHAMKLHTHVPISVKIRVEGGNDEKFHEEIIQVIHDAGADCLVVHGRDWTQGYETPCRYEDIRFFVDNVKIPVVGNGDVACYDSLQAMLATGCAGVMIARAGVGQPWLSKALIAQVQGKKFELPSLLARGEMLMMHIEGLAQLMQSEKVALLQARQFAKYYARDIPDRDAFIQAVHACDNIKSLYASIRRFFAISAHVPS
jgi:tRNA-dihydrouridine synthase B